MMRTTGFLAGICLTVAAFLLVLDSGKIQRLETVKETVVVPTAEELSAIATAIAEQVDVVQTETESVISEAEPQNNLVDVTGDGRPEEPSGIPATVVAQADIPQAGYESDMAAPEDHSLVTPDDQLQDSFEAPGMELEKLPVDTSDTGSYLFWSPFRSTWAARKLSGIGSAPISSPEASAWMASRMVCIDMAADVTGRPSIAPNAAPAPRCGGFAHAGGMSANRLQPISPTWLLLTGNGSLARSSLRRWR